MNWHARYVQQAKWTRDLREYIFDKVGLDQARRVLEVGCGTGAILGGLPNRISLNGLDLDPSALAECRTHARAASLIRGNALSLPFSNKSFDIVYCHYLLLWVRDPLQALLEMKRVTMSGGHVIAFAEPDYAHRTDEPKQLVELGRLQTRSLENQGADAGLGARLANLFFRAGIKIVETGIIPDAGIGPQPGDWDMEWSVIESDLEEMVPGEDLRKFKALDQQARADGKRILNVPTYFAWGSS